MTCGVAATLSIPVSPLFSCPGPLAQRLRFGQQAPAALRAGLHPRDVSCTPRPTRSNKQHAEISFERVDLPR